MCYGEVKKKKEMKVETFAIFLSGFFSIVILANSQAPTFKRSGGFIFHDPIGKNGGPQSPPFKQSGGFIVDDPIVDNSPRGAVSPKFKQSGKKTHLPMKLQLCPLCFIFIHFMISFTSIKCFLNLSHICY